MSEYIDREKFLKRLGEEYPGIPPHGAIVVGMLCDEEPADVRPVVRGHDTGKSRWFRCSVCDYGVNDLFEACENGMPSCYERKGDTGWNFCPNCGADMREAQP